MIYFIQPVGGGLVKVGFTENVRKRFQRLQLSSPVSLAILATRFGTRSYEAELHSRFASLREHGEWFRPEPELLAYIRDNAEPWPGFPPKLPSPDRDQLSPCDRKRLDRCDRDRQIIKAVMKCDRTKAQVAAQFGISRRALHKIEDRVFRGKSNPTRRWTRPDVKERARAPEEDVA